MAYKDIETVVGLCRETSWISSDGSPRRSFVWTPEASPGARRRNESKGCRYEGASENSADASLLETATVLHLPAP